MPDKKDKKEETPAEFVERAKTVREELADRLKQNAESAKEMEKKLDELKEKKDES